MVTATTAIVTVAAIGAGVTNGLGTMGRCARRYVLWLVLTTPIGVLAGGLLALLESDTNDFFRAAEIVGGAIIGGVLALFSAAIATVTTLLGGGVLQRAGGSDFLTGVVLSYGVLVIGLLMARTIDGTPVR